VKKIITDLIKESLCKIDKAAGTSINNIEVNLCKDKKFGDFSSNVAMKYSSKFNESPRNFAEKIIGQINKNDNIF
jgi:arginyl-tRNA synthetase